MGFTGIKLTSQFQATKDPFYLDVGERVLFDLTTRAKVPCGLTGISDLRNNKQDDRMESFALSETLKVSFDILEGKKYLTKTQTVSVSPLRRRQRATSRRLRLCFVHRRSHTQTTTQPNTNTPTVSQIRQSPMPCL